MTASYTPISKQLMLPQGLAASLEAIINKVLSLDTATSSLEKLAQKTLTLVLTELGFPLSFTVTSGIGDNNKILLVTSLTEGADCTINTSIKTLRELQENQQLTELIKQDKLDVTGDIKVAQQFANLAQNLDIDWQSELAKHIGDVATHKLMQLGKKVSAKLDFAAKQIQADASEYLVHEQRLVVTKTQIEQFNQKVNDVAQQVTALETRIAKLSKQ
ncbi:MAG: SCP2 sterol-binding domain-containing protein [Colwellia sp.]|nr:SCP2 sterol-binding domain-containing protein [Colwellia sp.]MCW8865815.1 SCP2 sterol-binding domain-containing protein [Colwellia sp.]MCW9081787.1 SCP2 sterol-binding domain-containing protein [Colwellia sp.]